MKTTYWLIVTGLAALLCAGCARTVRFSLLKDSNFGIPPVGKIKVFVNKEKDLCGEYFEKVSFYEVPTIREEIIKQLAMPKLRHRRIENSQRPYAMKKIDNFIEVVSDSSSAEMVIDLGVEEFTYASKKDIDDRVLTYALFGILGLALSSDDVIGMTLV